LFADDHGAGSADAADAPELAAGDLRAGGGGWRNIQSVIRSAIASLAHRMDACERESSGLRGAVRDTPTFADLHQAVSQRATAEDLHTLSLGLQDQLSRRADTLAERLAASQRENHALTERLAALEARMEACERGASASEEAMASKADVSSLRDLVSRSQLADSGLATRRELEDLARSRLTRAEVAEAMEGLARARDVEEVRRLCEERPARTEVREYVAGEVERAGREAGAAERRSREAGAALERLEAAVADCVRRGEFEKEVGSRVGARALEARLGRLATTVRDGAERAVRDGVASLDAELRRRPTAEHVARALEGKADAEEVRSALATKADAAAVAEAVRRKAEGVEVAGMRATLASLAAGGGGAGGEGGGGGPWSATAARLEALLESKADASEVRALRAAVDSRPGAGAVAAVEARAREAAAAAAGLDGAVRAASEGAEEAVAIAADARKAAEAAVERVERVETLGPLAGRWVWKSRELGEGGLVPWDHELENTDPDALVWDGAGSARITLLPAGLYRCSIGFFARRTPVVTILMDGSPIVTSAPGARAGVAAASAALSSSRLSRAGDDEAHTGPGGVTVHRHPVGSVAGVSLVQFLAVPQRAVISVLFECEVRGQGFLELKKM